jgi:hypothetical protein
MSYVKYDSNNSGGRWWLKDEDWKALEAAGWEVRWFANKDLKYFKTDSDGRWLGALASQAIKRNSTLLAAAEEWERLTGGCSTDAGCACCGQPHSFTEYTDDDKYVRSGPSTSYSASW